NRQPCEHPGSTVGCLCQAGTMPESPEVQALSEQVGERLAGRALAAVDVLEFRLIKTRSRLPDTLVGEPVTGARRFGKLVALAFGGQHLVISLGRHGWARWGGDDPAPDAPPTLAVLDFDDGTQLELTDAGGWVSLGTWVVDDPVDVSSVASLGPDPAHSSYSRAEF